MSPAYIEKCLGSAVRFHRLSRQISQKELADNLNVSFQQIQKYEGGINRISASSLWSICKFLTIEPRDIFIVLDSLLKNQKEACRRAECLSKLTAQDVDFLEAYKSIKDPFVKLRLHKMCVKLGS